MVVGVLVAVARRDDNGGTIADRSVNCTLQFDAAVTEATKGHVDDVSGSLVLRGYVRSTP